MDKKRRTMTQEKMMRQTANNLCRVLKRYGIEAKPDRRICRIEKILRMCWYVPRIKEMGYNECIYIDMPDGMGFFVVTDTCEILTASNFMICDAIEDILLDIGYFDDMMDTFSKFKWRGRQEYEDSDYGIIVTQVTQLERAMQIVYTLNEERFSRAMNEQAAGADKVAFHDAFINNTNQISNGN